MEGIGPAVIATRGLTKHFGAVRALEDLDLQVAPGSVFGFLGPNGSGKTTTIRLLLALERPTRGQALVLGAPVSPGAAVLQQVGALVERPAFYPYLSALENLRLFGAARGIREPTASAAARTALERVGLSEVARRKVGGFSTGMRQRLGIGLALLDDPPLVILDEPTSGLDPAGTVDVRHLVVKLAREGKTVFLSTHLLSEAEQVCTEVAVVTRGRIAAQGTTGELFAGRERLVVRFASHADRTAGLTALRAAGLAATPSNGVSAEIDGQADGRTTIRHLADAGIYPAEVSLHHPSLEQIYLELTGEPGEADPAAVPAAPAGETPA